MVQFSNGLYVVNGVTFQEYTHIVPARADTKQEHNSNNMLQAIHCELLFTTSRVQSIDGIHSCAKSPKMAVSSMYSAVQLQSESEKIDI